VWDRKHIYEHLPRRVWTQGSRRLFQKVEQYGKFSPTSGYSFYNNYGDEDPTLPGKQVYYNCSELATLAPFWGTTLSSYCTQVISTICPKSYDAICVPAGFPAKATKSRCPDFACANCMTSLPGLQAPRYERVRRGSVRLRRLLQCPHLREPALRWLRGLQGRRGQHVLRVVVQRPHLAWWPVPVHALQRLLFLSQRPGQEESNNMRQVIRCKARGLGRKREMRPRELKKATTTAMT
jgi:hypothetical protein